MKKLLTAILIISFACALIAFAACENSEIYDNLNAMAKQSYSQITLQINSKGYAELNAQYVCSYSGDTAEINYTYTQLAKIDVSGGNVTLPENSVQTYTGTATVRNGAVTDINGDALNVKLEQISASGLRFESKFFKNVKHTETTFKADVTDAKSFTGDSSVSCTDMKVSVEFENGRSFSEEQNGALTVKVGSVLSKITVTYFDAESNANITLTYSFVK